MSASDRFVRILLAVALGASGVAPAAPPAPVRAGDAAVDQSLQIVPAAPRTPAAAEGDPAALREARAELIALSPAERLARSEWTQAMQQAQDAYNRGEYRRAAATFERLIGSGAESAELYYNLGNSELRARRVGRAIAAYRTSASLRPRDQDVQANLDYARRNVRDAVDPIEPWAPLRMLFFWRYVLSARETLLLAALVSLAFWSGMVVRLFRRESEILRWSIVALAVVVVALAGSLAARAFWPTQIAVVTAPEVKVRSGITRDATELFVLHEGAEGQVLDRDGGWLKIRLADGKRGWTPAAGVAVVQR